LFLRTLTGTTWPGDGCGSGDPPLEETPGRGQANRVFGLLGCEVGGDGVVCAAIIEGVREILRAGFSDILFEPLLFFLELCKSNRCQKKRKEEERKKWIGRRSSPLRQLFSEPSAPLSALPSWRPFLPPSAS